jgi:hypothetical protein
MGIRILVNCQTDLAHVVDTLRPPRSGTGRLDRGKQQRHQRADNRHHHEQLYKRKTV